MRLTILINEFSNLRARSDNNWAHKTRLQGLSAQVWNLLFLHSLILAGRIACVWSQLFSLRWNLYWIVYSELSKRPRKKKFPNVAATMREDRLIVGRSIADAGESMTLRLGRNQHNDVCNWAATKKKHHRLSATHLKYKEIKISSTSSNSSRWCLRSSSPWLLLLTA